MLKQTNINIMHSKIVNKTRYDDLGKPMKQTSYTIKNLGGNLLEKQFTIIKRSFISSTKHLSLDSTILVDELITKTFYRFRTFKLSSIWMLPMIHGSQYMTNSQQLKDGCWLQNSSLHQQWRSKNTWLQNPKVQRYSSFFKREWGIRSRSTCVSMYSGL